MTMPTDAIITPTCVESAERSRTVSAPAGANVRDAIDGEFAAAIDAYWGMVSLYADHMEHQLERMHAWGQDGKAVFPDTGLKIEHGLRPCPKTKTVTKT